MPSEMTSPERALSNDMPFMPATAGRLTVFVDEHVQDGQDLSVVGHQCLAHVVRAQRQMLQDLQGDAQDRGRARVERV